MEMTTTRRLIEDYTSITGRPIATITVEEYIRFAELTELIASPIKMSTRLPINDVQPIEALKKEAEEENCALADDIGSEPQKITFIPAETKLEKKAPSKEDMLKLMRSVHG